MGHDDAMAPALPTEHLADGEVRTPNDTGPAPPTLPTALLEADVIALLDGPPTSAAAAPDLPDSMLATAAAPTVPMSGTPVPDLPDDELTVASVPSRPAAAMAPAQIPDLPESALTAGHSPATTASVTRLESPDATSDQATGADTMVGVMAPDLPDDVLAPPLPAGGGTDTFAPDLPPGVLDGAPDVASDPDVAVPPFDVDERIFDDQWDELARRLASDEDLSAATQTDSAMPPDLPAEWLDVHDADDEIVETDPQEGDQAD